MPNMHKQRGRDRGKQYYYEHDDRDFIAGGSSDNVRRVSFKGTDRSYRRKNDNLQKKLSYAYILANDDIEMGGSSRRHEFVRSGSAPYHIGGRGFRGRGFRHPRDSPVPGGRRVLQESSSSWYKVQISSAHNYEKDYVIGILLGYIRPVTFIPYGFRKTGDDISFFVDDFSIAEQLFSADWKITANDGNKLRLHVRPNMPFIEVDDKLKEKLKLVMSRRYQVATQALDLRKFYSDPEFLQEDIFVPLNRPNIMQAVVQIICDSIPELRALDLSDNKIGTLDNLKPLVDKTTQLKILHIADNKLRHTNQLESLQGLPLEDLNIDGNPVCDKFKNQEAYVREIRKRFPKVIKLDNTALPPPIVFDVEDNVTLLPSKGSFLCDVNGGTVVRQFLEQYYTIFDSESRQPLIDAYHENAQFSMTCSPGLTSYLPDSRNLCIVQGLEKRQRLLRQGRSTVIAFLTGLIKTQHDPASFAVDLVLFTPQLISLSLTGVYREPLTKKAPIRSFSRVFIIVPAGSGFCIVNDLLSISNATADQIRDSFKIPVVVPSTPAPAPAPPVMVSPIGSGVISPPVVSPIASVPVPNAVETRQQMISTLAMQTGMNFAWSEKCLNETNWNFDSALFVFSQLNKEGKVPAEAFVK